MLATLVVVIQRADAINFRTADPKMSLGGVSCAGAVGFDEFWWVSMDFDDLWWILMDFDKFWWPLMDFDGFWWILMGFDGFLTWMIMVIIGKIVEMV